jgi:GNAT superfamily N-acetyltransferase
MTNPDALPPLRIVDEDPQGDAAMALLRLAALEVRAMYAQPGDPPAPPPRNEPLWPRGAYLIAWRGDQALGMGAHRPIDAHSTELRRVFVRTEARRQGIAQALLRAIEENASAQGFRCIKLETGERQQAAIAMYLSAGYCPIDAFGPYIGDPSSRCFGKRLPKQQAKPAIDGACPFPHPCETQPRLS